MRFVEWSRGFKCANWSIFLLMVKPLIAANSECDSGSDVYQVVLFGGEGRNRNESRPNEKHPKGFDLFVGDKRKCGKVNRCYMQARQAIGRRIRLAKPGPNSH